ncbi:MAG: LysM domain-containing protein [Desulfobacteraceae bacterium]
MVKRRGASRWMVLLALSGLMGCSKPQKSVPAASDIMPDLPPGLGIAFESLPVNDIDREASAPPAPPKKPVYVHNVKWLHETLFSIAHWYTGSGNNWKRLVDANPTIKPRQIHVGDLILIPEDILKTRQPMPAKFLKRLSVEKKPPHPSPSSDHVEMPQLYGPIDDEDQTEEKEASGLPVPLETLD